MGHPAHTTGVTLFRSIPNPASPRHVTDSHFLQIFTAARYASTRIILEFIYCLFYVYLLGLLL